MIINKNDSIPSFEGSTIDLMIGYLIYDLLVELFSTRALDMIGHHLLGLLSHISCRITDNEAGAFYRY
jgi:hypothetical protein